MINKTELRVHAYLCIYKMPAGRVFTNADLYRYLEDRFPVKASKRGDSKWEPRFQNDARWAVQDAKRDGYIEPVERGRFKRTSKRD